MSHINFNDYSIVVVMDAYKKNFLLKYPNRKFRIITLSEFQKKYYFTYDDRAIYYVMDKYHYQYEVASMYLSHLLDIVQSDVQFYKVDFLNNLFQDLDKQGLLIRDSFFKKYLCGKNILVYDKFLSSFDKNMFQSVMEYADVSYYEVPSLAYSHDGIVVCDTMDDEVSYVASSIVKLVHDGFSLKKIKVCASSSYENTIQRIFTWFHIPVFLYKSSLYSTEMGQYFLQHLDGTGKEILDELVLKFPLDNDMNQKIYDSIISILNRYVWCDSFLDLYPFLVRDFKMCYIDDGDNLLGIEVVSSLDYVNEDDYVFLLGFNQGEIPIIYKDEDYFSDDEKRILHLDTSDEMNARICDKWIYQIKSIKNLVITMKMNGESGECYLSNLNDILQLNLLEYSRCYECSHLYNQLMLSCDLDTLVKYNEVSCDVGRLYGIYSDIPYAVYDNSFTGISFSKLRDYLNGSLTLSYSSMNNYYQCAFRYYLSYILKLDIFNESFYTILGNAFHYVLASYFQDKEIIIKDVYEEYLSHLDYSFDAREKYFLSSLEKELEFIISVLNHQDEGCQLNQLYLEEKIEIEKNFENVCVKFKGFVDKMMLNDQLDEVAIIDYKTGNPDLNLNYVIYGLCLQLPVYVYLALYKFPQARVVGFYLQKILNSEIVRDEVHSYLSLKEDKLKLQGYTNSDMSLVSDFDSTYMDSRKIKGLKVTSRGVSSKKIFDDEKIKRLSEITNQKIDEAISDILHAKFEINPKRIGMSLEGCKYCKYKDICFMNEKNIVNLVEYKDMDFLGGDEIDTFEA